MYLLGVLNSASFWHEVEKHCSKIQNGFQLMRSYFGKCLIPMASASDRNAISDLVQMCVDSAASARQGIEGELNARVDALYFGAKRTGESK
jgi:hypothetical protein